MDLIALLQSVPGAGPYLPYIPIVIAIGAAVGVVLPAPKPKASSAYRVLYWIVQWCALNKGHAVNLSAPSSQGIVGGPDAIGAPRVATTSVAKSVPAAVFVVYAGALAGLIGLTGCSSPAPISSNPVTTAMNIATAVVPSAGGRSQAIQTQLINAQWNLDQAKELVPPILAADDPVDACVTQVNALIAGGNAASTSFTPRTTGLLDTAAAAYILAQQANAAKNGGLAVPVGCKAIIGDLVLKGAAGGIKLVPGGNLLPTLQ